jgi:lysophospholipase L1-like esterase
MVGNLCALVGEATSRPVEWRVIARPGATSSRIRNRLLAGVPDGQHGTVLMAGVNDIVAGRTPDEWADDIWAVIQTLHEQSERVVVTAIPPLRAFPALPARLGRALELRGEQFNAVTAVLCERLPRVAFATFDSRSFDDPFMFAVDGFHPSDLGYERWAPVVAARLIGPELAT